MKKLILLCTMLCAGQMYSMDPTSLPELRRTGPEQKTEYWNLLPKEVQPLVVQALYTSNNPDEAIHAIIAMSQTNKALNQLIHGDIKNFTALMNLLAKKFPHGTRKDIAEKFNTAAAQQYIEVNSRLLKAINFGELDTVKKLITQENADPNFSSYEKGILESPINQYNAQIAIGNAIRERKNAKEILQFLLKNGMSLTYGLPEINTIYMGTRPKDVQELLDQYKNQ